MNKMLITIAAVTLLISGCGDKEDAASGQAEPSAVEKTMESANDAMDSTADMASDAAESAGDAADAADSTAEMAAGAAESVDDAASDAADAGSDTASDATEEVAAVADGGEVGQKVYMKSCMACHAAGVAGAPKLGDKAAWAPRIATGMDALVTSSIKGKNVMPPRGTCASCSDDDLKAAVEYMVSQSQ
jgi:cytochrome c5